MQSRDGQHHSSSSHHTSRLKLEEELMRQRAKALDELKASHPEFGGKPQSQKSQRNIPEAWPNNQSNGLRITSGSSNMKDRKAFKENMQELLSKRKQEYEQEQILTQQRIKELREQRQRLEAEQIRLKQVKDKGKLLSPYKVLEPIELRNKDEGGNDGALGPTNVDHFVEKTSQRIPELVENIQKLKKQVLAEKEDKEHDSLSYKPWNLNYYFMVRDIVNDIMEGAVDKAHDSIHLKQTISQDTRLILDSSKKLLDHQQKFASREKVLQLISEELMLQITGRLTREIAEEWFAAEQYARYQAQHIILQTVDHVTTGKPEGRDPQEPAYDLITATFHRLCRDREHHRKEIYSHSQRLKSTSHHLGGKSESVLSLLSLQPDVQKLDFLKDLPNDVTRAYKDYREKEKLYWKNISITNTSTELSKKVKGISASAVSPNQRYVAFGSMKGDIIVYDLLHDPPFPVHGICNRNNIDAIKHLSWSTDASRLVTVTQAGKVQVWSMKSGPVSQQDIRELQLKTEVIIPAPSQLTPLVAMHAKKYDLNFKKGPLSETGAQSEIILPNVATFHPAHTLLGTQNHLMVGLNNGDILRCDLDQSIQKTLGIKTTQAAEIMTYPTVKPSGGESILGKEDISAELFRHHKVPIKHIGFVGNSDDMVSVDEKGHVFIWKYSKKWCTHFGWFEPKEKYIIDMAQRVYKPMENEEPVVHVGDLKETGTYSKLAMNTLDFAEEFLRKCSLDVLWHEEIHMKDKTTIKIYKPATVEETGSLFHTVRREESTGDLLQHYSFYCTPTKNVCSKWLGVQQTPSGQELVFMLLFPKFWPKGPHITFVIMNLETMQIKITDIKVKVTASEYKKCLENDVCSFHVSQPIDATGSSYIVCYILGVLRMFSMNTHTLSLAANVHGNSTKANPGVERTIVTVAGKGGKTYVISYSKVSTTIEFVKLQDKSPAQVRQSVYEAYTLWRPKNLAQIPVEQTLRQTRWEFDSDPNHHVEMFMYLLLWRCVDEAVSLSDSGSGPSSEEMKKYQREGRDWMYWKLALRMGYNPLDVNSRCSDHGDDVSGDNVSGVVSVTAQESGVSEASPDV